MDNDPAYSRFLRNQVQNKHLDQERMYGYTEINCQHRDHPLYFLRDVPAALDWLTRAFGFAETMRTTTPNGGTHGEMTLDGQRIMMGQGQSWRAPATLATGQK
jgi:hypothetical protein